MLGEQKFPKLSAQSQKEKVGDQELPKRDNTFLKWKEDCLENKLL